MTTSTSLSQETVDHKMGTGFMPFTFTFLKFFHLGRWEAMTSPTSSVSHNTSISSREKHLLTNGQNRYSALDCHHHQESICQLKSSEVKSAKVSGHVHSHHPLWLCSVSDPQWSALPVCHMIWHTRALAHKFHPLHILSPSVDSSTWAVGKQWHHQHLCCFISG